MAVSFKVSLPDERDLLFNPTAVGIVKLAVEFNLMSKGVSPREVVLSKLK